MPLEPIRLPDVPPFELWLVTLDHDPAEVSADVLDASERTRAASFRFERDRRRYVLAHVALRGLLAQRTGCAPAALAIESDALGKPRLAGAPRCAFNLSHSGERALIALADDGEIGVDIEAVRPLSDLDALAHQCLTEGERRRLGALPADGRSQAFLQLWTRKEACLKALGAGLQIEPSTFDVGGWADAARVRIETASGPRDVQVHSVMPAPGWVSAVASVT